MTETRIMLASGALFDLLDPAASDFTLHDIAHGLGRVCRFGGQCARHYSVAEHSVHVSRLVPLDLKPAALLHDAAEAFIGDVVRPLKALLPEYAIVERRVEDAIAARFLPGALPGGDAFHHPSIKAADLAMVRHEARFLMPTRPGYWSSLSVPPDMAERARTVRLLFDKPEYATAAWLREWNLTAHKIDDDMEDAA